MKIANPGDQCELAQAGLACYSKECCENSHFNASIAGTIATAEAIPGCTVKCGAGAMATPAAALFAVVMSMFYRLM